MRPACSCRLRRPVARRWPGPRPTTTRTRTATITPGATLTRGATYSVTVAASDTAGNAIAAPLSWSFTTAQADPDTRCLPVRHLGRRGVPGMITVNDPTNVELGAEVHARTPAASSRA